MHVFGATVYDFGDAQAALPRGMVGLELDPIHNVLDRNDGFWWPGMVRILGPCTVHTRVVFLLFCPLTLHFAFLYVYLLLRRFSGFVYTAWFNSSSSYSLPLSVFDYC